MKWTMISVALMGLATYAVIFLAQLQHSPDTAVTADDAAAQIELTTLATPKAPEVSDLPDAGGEVDEVELPGWDGDPWQAGVAAFEAHEDALAVDALRAAVAEREDSSYRHYLLGLALRRVGDVESAVIELERSLELSPAAQKSWIALARCELDRADTTAARAAVDAALELDLESADAWHLLGRVEMAEGSAEQAEAAFERALTRDGGHAWASNNLGYVRILQERFEDALAPLQDAVASGKDEPVFFNNLGIALERSGHSELAALSFAHAVLLGHGPAEQSMERVEERLESDGGAFAAIDSVEFVEPDDLAARVEQAVLLLSVEVADEAAGPEIAAAGDTSEPN